MDSALDTAESLALALKVKPATVRQWAREGKIPSVALGRLVRFDRAQVLEHLRTAGCRSTAAQTQVSGGPASRLAVAKFAARQAQRTKASPRNSSTSSVVVTGVRFGSENTSTPSDRPASGGSETGPGSAA